MNVVMATNIFLFVGGVLTVVSFLLSLYSLWLNHKQAKVYDVMCDVARLLQEQNDLLRGGVE